MNLSTIPLFDLLRQRMSWLSARENVISQNVANADTPGYSAQDLKPLDFAGMMRNLTMPQEFSPGLTLTNPRHIAVPAAGNSGFQDMASPDTLANPTGNTVSLEDEMMKVADTQAQYQAAANLYSKAVSLMRTAIGHG
ncbi:MAG: flagellar basal body rod protein FlgB [Alphaproteobacteria bacterium]|nr:flagellar basal body rod protein FlgB [Alphaproteobacteria bacterium]MBU6471028.1 flagellar basal body rod protein FlgB [Alphaproteobacteria bacterium]MDE2012220.1 flagellar basal body rod protein FlgB [Alphaproteobacteria bacterium]MDE2074865.1 flagellar basal body rod protein FlgB [Alphaproteobacteria bacterium]MDE2351477.1 flagellar basal body rod protein FlgB [Alphaproteobacteria bacterium]